MDNELIKSDNNAINVKVKSKIGRHKKVSSNSDTNKINNKKLISINIDNELYNCLSIIKNNDKVSINYIIINAIKEYIKLNYSDIYYKNYDNKDKVLLYINNDIINKYKDMYINDINNNPDNNTIEQSIITMIVNKVLNIDNDSMDKNNIKIEKDKVLDMFKEFIENKVAGKEKE